MEGAGSLISANYVYKQASRDGLTVVIFNNSLVVQNALGDPRIRIDFRKLGWVGAPSVGVPVCMSSALRRPRIFIRNCARKRAPSTETRDARSNGSRKANIR